MKELDSMPVLTQREVALMLALSKGEATGYQIARQYEYDSPQMTISNGMLYPALKRLESWRLIEGSRAIGKLPGRDARLYRLTSLGRAVLEWHLASYRRLVRLGESRM